MTRTFVQINCSLLRSPKLRGLSHAERWAYMCARVSPLSEFIGVFHYPAAMWAQDAALSECDLRQAIERIEGTNLIEWDEEEEQVRIVDYHRERPPDNASRSISLIRDFGNQLRVSNDGCSLALNAAAEFAVAAIERSRRWDPDGKEVEKLREALGVFLRATYQEHGEAFLAAVRFEIETSSKAAFGEIGSFFPNLLSTMSTPCPDPGLTRDEDETRRKQDKNQEIEKDADERAQVSSRKANQLMRSMQQMDLHRNDAQPRPREATKQSRLVIGDGE